MLLLWTSAGIFIPPAPPIRAYATISFALNNDGALSLSLPNDAEGSVQ